MRALKVADTLSSRWATFEYELYIAVGRPFACTHRLVIMGSVIQQQHAVGLNELFSCAQSSFMRDVIAHSKENI